MVDQQKEKSAAIPGLGDLKQMYRRPRAESFSQHIDLTLREEGTTHPFRKLQWNIEGQLRGLRYGTNPNQSAAIYVMEDFPTRLEKLEWVKWGKGGPSLTNIQDGVFGMQITELFSVPAVAVMKHLNPSGVAASLSLEGTLIDTYCRARDVDSRAAFGSVVASNRLVDELAAREIIRYFVEVVYAPDYTPEALEIFKTKESLRVAKIPLMTVAAPLPNISMLEREGALVLEDLYETTLNSIDAIKQLKVVTTRRPTESEYVALLAAWRVVTKVKSNAVAFWKDNAALAISGGSVDRVGAIEVGVSNAVRYKRSLKGSAMASDGFIPNVDNIEAVAMNGEGVSAIIQPGGSNADNAIIEACNKYGIAMVFTAERAFRH